MPMLAYGPGNAFQAGVALHDQQMARLQRQGMTARQLELNRYWSFYEAEPYAARSVGWDGRKVMGELERENIARTQVLPPGFWDPSGTDDMPLSMRRPTAPFHLVRAVVNRFTGLLFSAKKHPSVKHRNPAVQAWIEGVIASCRMWIRFAHGRMFGGGQGTAVMTFAFQGGRPVVEVHDPRWCTPTFINRSSGEVSALEIRYMFPTEQYGGDGILREVWFWYRRIIDQTSDVVFVPAPVGEGDEPVWQAQTRVDHGLGEFPGVWIRNTLTDQQDGDPDCLGEYDTQEAIDRLLSQADQAAVENLDPTLLIESDQLKLASLKKGSRNAIQVEKGAGATYLEIVGAGIEAGLKMVEVHRRNFLEVVQCVLDAEQTAGPMTATEVERRYSSMHERGDLFREQYGEQGVKPLLAKMIRAAIKVRTSGPTDPQTGLRLVGAVSLPPVEGPDGQPVERELPPTVTTITADDLELVWPEWVQRGPSDAGDAASAISQARLAQAIDLESAVQYLAPFFGVSDPAEALKRIRMERAGGDEALMADLLGRQVSSPGAPADIAAPPSAPAAPAGHPPSGKAADAMIAGPQMEALVALVVRVTGGELAPAAAAHLLAFLAGMPLDVAISIVEAQSMLVKPAPASPVAPPAVPPAEAPPA
jgi:hypothetical protein